MANYLSVELERQRQRDLDRVAAEGAMSRRWVLEAREARSGEKKVPVEGPILWARPNWTPDWKVARRTV